METNAPLHASCVTDTDAPAFDAEWQRRAFGVAVALSEFGHYPWEAFQRELIAAIGAWEAERPGRPSGWRYYDHWLAALEHVLISHSLVDEGELRALTQP
ncbi:nitrile hydratase accessory protein [Streptomyces flaveolus]|uniref:nitrile hydratase accessory protein n=1 Tax=Streptomyces flaveolus TaxID=67297 RepID=UPI0033EFFE25